MRSLNTVELRKATTRWCDGCKIRTHREPRGGVPLSRRGVYIEGQHSLMHRCFTKYKTTCRPCSEHAFVTLPNSSSKHFEVIFNSSNMTSNSYPNDVFLDQDVLPLSLYAADLLEREDRTYTHLRGIDANNWPSALIEQSDWTVEDGTIPEQATAMIRSLTHGWRRPPNRLHVLTVRPCQN